jgi:hypothetical protein
MASISDPRGRRRAASVAAAALAALAALAPAGARADLFSPGPLARAHESLEGLAHCTDCHEAGKKLAPERCLACHVELKDRVAKGQGFHGKLPEKDRGACETCHKDHQGREFRMIDWGPGGRDRFDHARTGMPLRGKHAKAACAKCHDARLITDPQIRAMLAKRPGATTLLGAPASCVTCHFDEHREQVTTDCKKCHDDLGWKPARGFDHARSRYPLTGKHAKVECAKCHPKKEDEATPAGTFPAPVAKAFTVFKPLLFGKCIDCHKKDPHEGRFGESCESCHTTRTWKEILGKGKEAAFHMKTKYPLLGAHLFVACKACHGPWGGGKPKWKGLPFQSCTDCHMDSHVGQLARPERPSPDCAACHTVKGWQPVRYELEQHLKGTYPLAGGHRVVSCIACHPRDERIASRVPAAVRSRMAFEGRPVKVSEVVLARPTPERCETCHRDPHAGQFKPRTQPSACVQCHNVNGWSQLAFDHAKDSRFPLVGKHAKAACAACHPRREDGVVRYRPLEVACAGCHGDPHGGQFVRRRGTPVDCARCHDEHSNKASRFVHAPPFTNYRLKGKHVPLKCEACHRKVMVPGAAAPIVRYRPLPAACEGCHADFHKGAFRGFEP